MKIVAGVLLVGAAIVIGVQFLGGGGGFDPQAAARPVKIVCKETGETWEMEQGRLVDALYMREAPIDPNEGLSSPAAAGRPVAFPEDMKLWQSLVERVNREKAAFSNAPSD